MQINTILYFFPELIRRDLKMRYLDSLLGGVWAFLHPLLYMLIISVVFGFVFKLRHADNSPYFLWLLCGMLPWNWFAAGLSGAAESYLKNPELVGKFPEPSSLLPFVRPFSEGILHVMLTSLLLVVTAVFSSSSIHLFLLLYYSIALLIFLCTIGSLFAALSVVVRDIAYVVPALLNLLFWVTPVVWDLNLVPGKWSFLIFINPVAYIVAGYRSAILSAMSPVNGILINCIFWGWVLFLLFITFIVNRFLRKNLADYL